MPIKTLQITAAPLPTILYTPTAKSLGLLAYCGVLVFQLPVRLSHSSSTSELPLINVDINNDIDGSRIIIGNPSRPRNTAFNLNDFASASQLGSLQNSENDGQN